MIEAKFYLRKSNTEELVRCAIYDSGNIIDDLIITNNHNLLKLCTIEKTSNLMLSRLSFFENEILFYFYIKYLACVDHLFSKYFIEKVRFEGNIDQINYIMSYCQMKGVSVGRRFSDMGFKINLGLRLIKSVVTILGGAFYTSIIPLLFRHKISKKLLYSNKEFALIHSKASYNKIKNVFKTNVIYYYDSLNQKLPNDENHLPFYSVLNGIDILINIFTFPFKGIILFCRVFFSSYRILGIWGAIFSTSFFSKRISHFILIRKCYYKIFTHSRAKIFYSGEKESRFGALAMDIRVKNKIKGIAIPHGLAYSYKYPLGIFGDTYYSITEVEAEYLNSQYKSRKFIFDKSITSKMFSFNINIKRHDIIFFTEPRRIEVNIIIIDALLNILPTIKVQLHPLDSKANYARYNNLQYGSEYSESISGNICIARKSTILIESLYNNSIPISVLFDADDRFEFENTFPSLQIDGIKKVYTKEQLERVLNEVV